MMTPLKRNALMLTAIASLALALAGCAGTASEKTEAGPQGLIQPGTLTTCTYPEYHPMEYFEGGTGGEIVGFDVDLARAVGDSWGVQTKVVNTAFDGLIPGLDAQRCDLVISGLSVSDARREVADAVPYMLTGYAFAIQSGKNSLENPEDYSSRTVAVLAGSRMVAKLKTVNEQLASEGKPLIKIDEYPGTPLAAGAVISGKADAVIDTDIAIASLVSKSNGTLEAVTSAFDPDEVFGAYLRKDGALTGSFRDALKALHEKGTLAALAERYGLEPNKIDLSSNLSSKK
ncbi:polar amino acid transport system substrate-binding protein [Arthrobacter sp. cf158]|nr:polar amino acid transport system substrate-binding protein [Arthrobacter sp. cf158]